MGAMGALTKPVRTKQSLDEMFTRLRQYVEPRTKRLLVVDADNAERSAILDLVGRMNWTSALPLPPPPTKTLRPQGRLTSIAVVVGVDLPDMYRV